MNDNWDQTPVHLGAYVMWRLNWIHPFADGNGRTSRVLSFFVLSVRLGFVLPGSPTLPELVIAHRTEYEDALDEADAAYKNEKVIDVSKMERLIESLLAKQLHHVYELASGRTTLLGGGRFAIRSERHLIVIRVDGCPCARDALVRNFV